jgi:hypothetical protein
MRNLYIFKKVKSNFLPLSIIIHLVPITFETLKLPNVKSDKKYNFFYSFQICSNSVVNMAE